MSNSRFELSEYQGMWLFVLFDLPVMKKVQRKRYAQFRSLLLDEGFSMMQFSVYARYCASEAMSEPLRKRIRQEIPQDGAVRLLLVTDRQFAKMENFFGKTEVEVEQPPEQLLLF